MQVQTIQHQRSETLKLLSSLKEVNDFKTLEIIQQDAHLLIDSEGQHLRLESGFRSPIPCQCVSIDCTDAILLTFLLHSLGLESISPINYTSKGIVAELSDGLDCLYLIKEDRSYIKENLI